MFQLCTNMYLKNKYENVTAVLLTKCAILCLRNISGFNNAIN